MADKLQKLYDDVSQEFDVGTIDEFKSSLSNPEKLQKAYNFVGKKYEVGTLDEFRRSIGMFNIRPDVNSLPSGDVPTPAAQPPNTRTMAEQEAKVFGDNITPKPEPASSLATKPVDAVALFDQTAKALQEKESATRLDPRFGYGGLRATQIEKEAEAFKPELDKVKNIDYRRTALQQNIDSLNAELDKKKGVLDSLNNVLTQKEVGLDLTSKEQVDGFNAIAGEAKTIAEQFNATRDEGLKLIDQINALTDERNKIVGDPRLSSIMEKSDELQSIVKTGIYDDQAKLMSQMKGLGVPPIALTPETPKLTQGKPIGGEPMGETESAKAAAQLAVVGSGNTTQQAKNIIEGRETPARRILRQMGVDATGLIQGTIEYGARVAAAAGDHNQAKIINATSKRITDKLQEWMDEDMVNDPNFVEKLAGGAASMATMMGPSLMVGGALKIIGAGPKLAQFAGLSFGTLFEAAGEAGNVKRELMAQGMKEDDANAKADQVFGANAVLLYITNKYGLFDEASKGVVKKAAQNFIAEGGQEGAQAVISNWATGKPLLDSVAEQVIIGGILGAGASPAVDGIHRAMQYRAIQADRAGRKGDVRKHEFIAGTEGLPKFDPRITQDVFDASFKNSVPAVEGSDGKLYFGTKTHGEAPLPPNVEPIGSGWVYNGEYRSLEQLGFGKAPQVGKTNDPLPPLTDQEKVQESIRQAPTKTPVQAPTNEQKQPAQAQTPVTPTSATEIPSFTSTEAAHEYGKAATPEQIAELSKLREEKIAASRQATSEKRMQDAINLATEAQFYREAIEASQGNAPKVPESPNGPEQPVSPESGNNSPAQIPQQEGNDSPGQAAPLPAPEPVRGKESWEMTKAEYISVGHDPKRPNYDYYLQVSHERQVRDALSEGKPVPKEVLADYPDLAPPSAPQVPKPDSGKGQGKGGATPTKKIEATLFHGGETKNNGMMYLSADRKFAGEFGDVTEYNVKIDKPYDFDGGGYKYEDGSVALDQHNEPITIGYLDAHPEIVDDLIRRGYDGAIDGEDFIVSLFPKEQVSKPQSPAPQAGEGKGNIPSNRAQVGNTPLKPAAKPPIHRPLESKYKDTKGKDRTFRTYKQKYDALAPQAKQQVDEQAEKKHDNEHDNLFWKAVKAGKEEVTVGELTTDKGTGYIVSSESPETVFANHMKDRDTKTVNAVGRQAVDTKKKQDATEQALKEQKESFLAELQRAMDTVIKASGVKWDEMIEGGTQNQIEDWYEAVANSIGERGAKALLEAGFKLNKEKTKIILKVGNTTFDTPIGNIAMWHERVRKGFKSTVNAKPETFTAESTKLTRSEKMERQAGIGYTRILADVQDAEANLEQAKSSGNKKLVKVFTEQLAQAKEELAFFEKNTVHDIVQNRYSRGVENGEVSIRVLKDDKVEVEFNGQTQVFEDESDGESWVKKQMRDEVLTTELPMPIYPTIQEGKDGKPQLSEEEQRLADEVKNMLGGDELQASVPGLDYIVAKIAKIARQVARAFTGKAYIPVDDMAPFTGNVAQKLAYDTTAETRYIVALMGLPYYVGDRIPVIKQIFNAFRTSMFEGNARFNEVKSLMDTMIREMKPTDREKARVAQALYRGNDKDVQRYFDNAEVRRLFGLTDREQLMYQTLVEAQKKATEIRLDAIRFFLQQENLADSDVLNIDLDKYVPGANSLAEQINDLLTPEQIELFQKVQKELKGKPEDVKFVVRHEGKYYNVYRTQVGKPDEMVSSGASTHEQAAHNRNKLKAAHYRIVLDDVDVREEFDNIKRLIQEPVIEEYLNREVAKLGGYISLQRHGDYFVAWTDPKTGDRNWQQFELQGEAARAAKAMTERGEEKVEFGTMSQINLAQFSGGRMSLDELLTLVDQLGIKGDPEVQRLIDEFKSMGMAAHSIQRKYTPGYERTWQSGVRSIHDYAQGAARHLTRTKGKILAEKAFEGIDAKSQPLEAKLGRAYIDGYTGASENQASLLRKATYFGALTWSPSFLIQQIFQPLTTHYFNVVLEVGTVEATKIMSNAAMMTANYVARRAKQKMAGLKTIPQQTLVDQMIERARNRGSTTGLMFDDITGSTRLGGHLAAPRTTEMLVNRGMQKETVQEFLAAIEATLAAGGSITEKANRIQGFVQGVLMGQRRGLTDEALYRFAEDWTERVNIPYGPQNLPIAIQNLGKGKGLARWAFSFMPFQFAITHMMFNVWRGNAPASRKVAAFATGTTAWTLNAGLMGMPYAVIVMAIYQALSGDDRPLEEVQKLQKNENAWLRAIGLVLDGGVPALAGMDLRRSLGAGEINPLDISRTVPVRMYEIAGDMYREYERGEYGKAISKFPIGLPPPVRSLARFHKAEEFGIPYGRGNVGKLDELSNWERYLYAIGVTPYSVGKKFDVERTKAEAQQKRSDTMDKLADKYAIALRRDDSKTIDKVIEELREYNDRSRPGYQIAPKQFIEAIKYRARQLEGGKEATESRKERMRRRAIEESVGAE